VGSAAPGIRDGTFRVRPGHSQVTPATVAVVLATALTIAGGLLVLWALREIVLWTLAAVILAVALSPAVERLRRRRVPRGLAVLLVYGLLLLVIAGIGTLLVPPLFGQVRGLMEFALWQAEAAGEFPRAAEALASRYGFGGDVASLLAQAHALASQLSVVDGPLLALTRGIISGVTALAVILVLSYLLLLDGGRLADIGLGLVASARRPRLRRLLDQSADAIHGYVVGNLAISLMAGGTAFVALTILRVPYALALALVVALFDLLPLVGAFIGAGIAVVVALSVGPVAAVTLAAYFAIYQQVENHVLQPLVYGRAVRLHPLAIILAVLAGAELLGVYGALLAIPLAEIIRIFAAGWRSGPGRGPMAQAIRQTSAPRST
jgi:predicted PurR-regulated permease PerM